MVSIYNVYITNQFQTTFAPGVGAGVKSVSGCDYSSNEENSQEFFPNYVQEFDLWYTV